MSIEMGEDLDVDLEHFPPKPEEVDARVSNNTVIINAADLNADTIKAAWAQRTVTSEPNQPNPHRIPPFEGEPVDFAKLKLTSVSSVEIDDEVFKMDQLVRLVIEGRVTRIDHVVNERTGKMERIQTVKAIEATVADWDS